MAHDYFNRKTSGPIPHYQRRDRFLSDPEIAAYNVLTKVFDEDVKVFTKVALSQLIDRFRPDEKQVSHWTRVQLRRIDFLACAGPVLEPILAVKIVTNSNRGVIDDVLEDIGLPLLRLRPRDNYDVEDITSKINFALQESQLAGMTTHEGDYLPDQMTSDVDSDSTTIFDRSTTLRFLTSIRDKYRVRRGHIPADMNQ